MVLYNDREKVKGWKEGMADLSFFCPGCECDHGVWVRPNKNILTDSCWTWNGSMDKPTFSPSILVQTSYKDVQKVCHSFVKNGQIQYLSDCTHKLAGQTIDLPPYEV